MLRDPFGHVARGFVLPSPEHIPAGGGQALIDRAISGDVAVELGHPVGGVGFGLFPWMGQRCQKQPSMKMASLWRVNTTSGRTTRSGRRIG